jgi:tocopherol cyclase
MAQRFKTLWKPDVYHGGGKRDTFFEGWFYKIVSPDGRTVLAIIPGVFLDPKGNTSHAFIQILDSATHASSYCRFPMSEFSSSEATLDTMIGGNRFTSKSVTVDIRAEGISLKGAIQLGELARWPVTLFSPGIMGWYSFVPFMECYHGVVSLDHSLSGTLEYNGRTISFEGGRGYIEKDWGRSFPSAYVWMQSNHFGAPGISLSASVAKIPWLGHWFRGFIVGFLHEGTLHRFTTYLNSRLSDVSIGETRVSFRVRNRTHQMEIHAERKNSGILHGPYQKQMLQRVSESLDSVIHVRLSERTGAQKVVFEGVGEHAGVEGNGTTEEIAG